MKKATIILLVLVLAIFVGYSTYRTSDTPTQGEQASQEPRIFTEEEKMDVLENLARQSTSTVPTVAEQQKILESLSGGSQAPAEGKQAPASGDSGGLSEEEKKKILESLAQ